jgi:hypothetical protein
VTPFCAVPLRWLPALRKGDPGRQCTQRDLPTTAVDISENANAPAAIIEVDCAEAMPEFDGKTAQRDSNVFLFEVMDSISAR